MKAQQVGCHFLINSSLIGFLVEDLQNLLTELKDKGNAGSLKKSEAYSKSHGQGGMFMVLLQILLAYRLQ